MNRKSIVLSIGTLLATTAIVTGCGGVGQETSSLQQAVGVTDAAFYVDGELYRTVGTPRDLPTNAPDDSFDTIYVVPNQYNVAEAAPGSDGFNGGRWMVHLLSFDDYEMALSMYDSNGSGDFDSVAEIHDALQGGAATDEGIVRVFECPVIHLPRNS